MKIKLNNIKIKDLTKNYSSSLADGVQGYNGRLNIRPKYQREFVYNDKQREAVINTVQNGFPLNTMYWSVNNHDDAEYKYEVLDGQQRTISIAQYINGEYSIDYKFFHNLTPEEQKQILNYELQVYFCEGDEKEKLDWFRVVNIAGEKLTEQELRNAVYTGSWLTEAKTYFSKPNAPAKAIAEDYISGKLIRQEYLETAIDWISDGEIEEYMAKHQHDKNADPLWKHFQAVVSWVKKTFPEYRKEMKGVNWGSLYSQYGKTKLDPNKLEKEVSSLMQDEEVSNRKGVYTYVLNREEKFLNIRGFKDNTKREAYERQKGICPKCKKKFKIEEMESDHITPWSKGGKTSVDNCQMLCKDDNRKKSNV